jgi:hypothetical protein
VLIDYVEGCAKGAIGISECGPVWQLGVIVGLLVVATVALCAMRLRAGTIVQEGRKQIA